MFKSNNWFNKGNELFNKYTVRAVYLYICIGSLLLSGAAILILHSAAGYLYARNTPDSAAMAIRLLRWIINHIGRTPVALLLFAGLFVLFFLLRSQKQADDLRSLVQATGDLAQRGSLRELKVMSGGELGLIAEHLRILDSREPFPPAAAPAAPSAMESAGVERPGHEELLTLALRLRTLQRMLDTLTHNASLEGWPAEQLKALRHEAAGMEQVLASLLAES
ncbi:hypothetical protein [Paenibacillus tepidiphilus]|uniref:hypothetical protein n=1 Tax=Paenibacillus tepidiphilus TaxID=2608683 RepID=UPI00123990DC|nr:hypothetical protein [Paenibacillus tepidiphilus]